MSFESPMRRTRPTVSEIELDLGRYELRRQGRRVKLEKKPMELLIFLVSRRDQMVSRQEIVGKLWGSDLFIDTEANINNIVRKIRTALRDDSAKPRFLETVVGKGYRFIGPMRVIDPRHPSGDLGQTPSHQASANPVLEHSSLAVLPLSLLGKIADDQGACLGFADALVTRLGNIQGVDVLPTSAVLNVPLETAPVDIASRLGVRFVVHGAIQFSKEQWRLSVEMLDMHLQRVCFTRKRDLELQQLDELVDKIARQIAATLNRPLGPPIVETRPRYSKEPMAYAEFMSGYRLSSSGDTSLLDQAAQHLSNAVTRDPAFSLAHATLSFVCAVRHFELDPANMWLE